MTDKELFFEMIEQIPSIAQLFDKEKSALKVSEFESALLVMSSGEVHMAKFFVSVWFNNSSRYGFDLIDAVYVIDGAWRKIIINWIADPFYP